VPASISARSLHADHQRDLGLKASALRKHCSVQLVSQLPTGTGTRGKGREIIPPSKPNTYIRLPQPAPHQVFARQRRNVSHQKPIFLVSKEETLEWVAQGGDRCPIPGNIQGQVGRGSEQPALVDDVPAHCRGRWTR